MHAPYPSPTSLPSNRIPAFSFSSNGRTGGRFSMGGDGVARTEPRTVGASRAVDRTVFWNLVVHFREHCLPITFLLADASAGKGKTLRVFSGSVGTLGEVHPSGGMLLWKYFITASCSCALSGARCALFGQGPFTDCSATQASSIVHAWRTNRWPMVCGAFEDSVRLPRLFAFALHVVSHRRRPPRSCSCSPPPVLFRSMSP